MNENLIENIDDMLFSILNNDISEENLNYLLLVF